MMATFYINGTIGDEGNTAEALGEFLEASPSPAFLVVDSPAGIATKGTTAGATAISERVSVATFNFGRFKHAPKALVEMASCEGWTKVEEEA